MRRNECLNLLSLSKEIHLSLLTWTSRELLQFLLGNVTVPTPANYLLMSPICAFSRKFRFRIFRFYRFAGPVLLWLSFRTDIIDHGFVKNIFMSMFLLYWFCFHCIDFELPPIYVTTLFLLLKSNQTLMLWPRRTYFLIIFLFETEN